VLPAFAHVGAARGFADGMKIESAHGAFEVLVAFAAKEFDAEPVWARVSLGRRYRRRPVGDDVKGSGHCEGVDSLYYFLLWRVTNAIPTAATRSVC